MRRYIFLAAVCAVSSGPANAQDWIGPTPLDLGIQFSNQIGSGKRPVNTVLRGSVR